MAIFTTSREQVIISTGFQKVRSWRKSSRRAEQPMKVPAITWAIFFAALGMWPAWNTAVSTADAMTAPISIPAGTRFR